MRRPSSSDVNLDAFVGSGEIVTSRQLQDRLVAAGKTPVNARKIISRGHQDGRLWRSEKFRLPGNERLFALRDYWGTRDYCEKVAELITTTKRPGIARCLAAILLDDLLLPVKAQRLLASPVGQVSKARYPDYDAEVDAMTELGINAHHRGSSLEFLSRRKLGNSTDVDRDFIRRLAQQRVEALLARVLVTHYRQQNLLTWHRYELADIETGFVHFNGQLFSAVGYSYAGALAVWKEGKTVGCPVLFDVHAGRCHLHDAQAFAHRIERATHRGKGQQRVLGVIAAKGFSKEAFDCARRHRMLTIDLRQLFGEEALEVMILVEKLLGRLDTDPDTATSLRDLGQITSLLDQLKANPIVVTIRSLTFEAFTCSVIQARGYQDCGLGKDVPFGETTRDVDVYGWRGDLVRVIECKANNAAAELADGDVTKFFTQTVPSFLAWAKASGREVTTCKAELWTTGQIGQKALDEYDKLRLKANVQAKLLAMEDIEEVIPPNLRRKGLDLLNNIRACQPKDSEAARAHFKK